MLLWTQRYTCLLFNLWLGYTPRSGIAESHGSSIFALRDLHTFYGGCTTYTPPTVSEGSLSPHPLQHMLCRPMDNGHSDWREAIHHCGFFFPFSQVLLHAFQRFMRNLELLSSWWIDFSYNIFVLFILRYPYPWRYPGLEVY